MMTSPELTHQEVDRNLLDSSIGKAVAAGVIAAEVSPLNEVLRGAAAAGVLFATRDPFIAAGAFTAATAIIEGGAAITAAEALDSKFGKGMVSKVNHKLRAVGIREDARTNAVTDYGVGLLGGSAVAMLVKQAQDPERTKEKNRNFGLKITAGTTAMVGGLAFAAAEGIANPSVETIGATTVAVGGLATFIGWAKKKLGKEQLSDSTLLSHLDKGTGITIAEVGEYQQSISEKAAEFEQRIWDENDFGSLKVYDENNQDSKLFIATKESGDVVGVTRMFSGKKIAPPFMDLPFYDYTDKESLEKMGHDGLLEELGTTAVDHNNSGAEKGVISTNMWRLAYRDACARGIKKWGIIMEPERVQKMNEAFGFTFKQLGPVEYYQGGDCAAFLMDLDEVNDVMKANMPELHHWFVEEQL